MCVTLTYMEPMSAPYSTPDDGKSKGRALREDRLGFRLDGETKELIERAAQLEHRKVSDFCLTAIAEAARRTIAEHEMLVLTEADRAAFFDALVTPPELSPRLVRAFADHARLISR